MNLDENINKQILINKIQKAETVEDIISAFKSTFNISDETPAPPSEYETKYEATYIPSEKEITGPTTFRAKYIELPPVYFKYPLDEIADTNMDGQKYIDNDIRYKVLKSIEPYIYIDKKQKINAENYYAIYRVSVKIDLDALTDKRSYI